MRGKAYTQLILTVHGAPLSRWRAGAHIMLEVAANIWRAYWLCQAPDVVSECHLVIRRGRAGFGRAFFNRVAVGDRLRIQEPHEHFALAPAAKRHLLLGTGIGIAPLLSMACQLQIERRDFHLVVAGKSAKQIPFTVDLHATPIACNLAWSPSACIEKKTKRRRADNATLKLHILSLLSSEPPYAHLYVCGTATFIATVIDAARQLDWGEHRLHRAYVGPPPQATLLGAAFDVVLPDRELKIHVPADRTLAEMLHANGVAVPVACGIGVCNGCLIRVREGVVAHCDYHTSGREAQIEGCMASCCSRAAHEMLILDL
jgi:vanillate O-demethylase ferredoxin subunit